MTRFGGAPARRAGTVLAGAVTAAGAVATLVVSQARWTVRRGDLPRVAGCDASGVEGDAGPRIRLAAIGDSTLTGPGLGHGGEVWIRSVARSVAARHGASVEVRSFAVEGARVHDVVRSQLDDALTFAPHVVVTAVGTNDAVHLTPLGRVGRDLDVLVCTLTASVPAVVIGGVGDLGGIARVPFPLTRVLRSSGRRVDAVIREVVAAHSSHYIDVSTVDAPFRLGGASLFSPDLFHPNELGHALWAQAATPVVLHAVSLAGLVPTAGSDSARPQR